MFDSSVGKNYATVDTVNSSASTQCAPEPFRSESDLEAAKQRIYAAPTWKEKLAAWRAWCRLLDQRLSPPSTSPGIAQATGECSRAAAGGAT
jgi:hypothetical protein